MNLSYKYTRDCGPKSLLGQQRHHAVFSAGLVASWQSRVVPRRASPHGPLLRPVPSGSQRPCLALKSNLKSASGLQQGSQVLPVRLSLRFNHMRTAAGMAVGLSTTSDDTLQAYACALDNESGCLSSVSPHCQSHLWLGCSLNVSGVVILSLILDDMRRPCALQVLEGSA